ncbi:carotenoid oxygenase family protein [Mycobacterium sp.]|uniref:carotenoid oxygenase family protein n=1 Tax=Mycobacterium sp. TaxID=1785 RepID=UPI0031D383E6
MTSADTVLPVFRTNHAPVGDELTAFDLPVDGAIPAELDGWYLRNGPNPRQRGGHWFTGDGMIHGVRLQGGRAAWYRNRWVRTESFERPFPVYGPDGTRNLHSSVANTHVVRHAGRTLALSESSLPYEITNELATLGVYDFGGKLANSMTAHPKLCPDTGELHFFGYGSLLAPHVTYHRADASGELVVNRGVEVGGLTMMHDFALTAGHVIFLDLPVVFDLDVALRRDGDVPYRWRDDYGARLGVLRRDDPHGPMRWFDVEPCYVFHVVNAYDHADSIVLHVVRYSRLWRGTSGFDTDTHAVLWRWTIDLADGTVNETQLDDRGVEFPRIDDRRTGSPARYAVTVGSGALIRYDLDRGGADEQRLGAAEPGEAVFAPAAGSDEASGWYLCYVYDPSRDGSDLLVIDASDFSAEPVARVRLPRRVPHGLHGSWITD